MPEQNSGHLEVPDDRDRNFREQIHADLPVRDTEQLEVDSGELEPSVTNYSQITPAESGDSNIVEQKENKFRSALKKSSIALFLGGSALALATNPAGEMKDDLIDAAPWVLLAGGTTEAMWVGGLAVMAVGAGKRIGNPLKLRERYGEITQDVVSSKTFRTGLYINTVGAVGTAGVIAGGAISGLPPETWPGAVGLASADLLMTAGIRSGLYLNIKDSKDNDIDLEKPPKVTVRKAQVDDIDRLADIDLLLFDKAYGTEKPEKKEIVDMLTKRLNNNPDWMYVAEIRGEVEGFVSAFQTNKPIEDFTSWEDSTGGGTLEGKVDPEGNYAYVTNMTIKHEAVELGAEEMLLANLFANGIRAGVEYGYFVGRMPHFKRWLESEGLDVSAESAGANAERYLNSKNENGDRIDPQVRMYESFGFKLERLVDNAFEDDASMNYGTVFKAYVPPPESLKKFKTARIITSALLRQIAKKPKLLKKVL